jgi:large subunit ribosomal protein L32
MAVPKRRTSKARKNSRRANWKLSAPTLSACPQCHEPKLAHRVCGNCGYYNGKLVDASIAADKKK